MHRPHAYHRRHDSEEIRKEYEECEQLKKKCVKILSDLDLKSTDAGQLAESLCDRKEFNYLTSRTEQGLQHQHKTEGE